MHPGLSLSIYKSTAGSGKTFTLVRAYLRIVLKRPEDYRHILAITFTNKAAGEMKERILGALEQLAAGKGEELAALLTEEDGVEAESLRENAAKALSFILHDYHNFNVSTIDAFTHRIVRNFTHELNLPAKYDVEMDQKNLMSRMVGLLMDLIGREPYITRMLVEFVQERLSQEANWNLDQSLVKTAGLIFDDESAAPVERLHSIGEEHFPAFIHFLKEKRDQYILRVKELSAQALEFIREAGLNISDFSGGKDSGASIFLKVQRPLSPEEYEKLLSTGRFASAVTEDKWYAAKADPALFEAVLSAGLRDTAQELFSYHQAHYKEFVTAWYAYSNIYGLALIRRVEALTEEFKERNNLLHISDFQRKVSQFITVESPDYLYWRLGERYRHFLIDEFQDTSVMQWQNLLPLFDHLLSGGHETGSILLVGDSRQAIYRWRGGETRLMEIQAPQHLQVKPQVLDTNYRSREAIVQFNNFFFSILSNVLESREQLRQIYQQVEQKVRDSKKGGGYVRVELLETAQNKELPLERSLNLIGELKADGFSYSDIAILVRQKEEGSRMANFLVEQGIPVISSDSLLLYKNHGVSFLLNLLKKINDPGDRIAEATIGFFIRQKEGLSHEDPQGQLLPPQFLHLVGNPAKMSLYEITEELVRIFSLNEGAPAYVQRFLDVVMEYSEKGMPGIAGFLDWWEERKHNYSLVLPAGENAVEILTIHKAKGLQFPVVILPFVNWRIKPNMESTLWAEADIGDESEKTPGIYLLPARKQLAATAFAEAWEEETAKTLLDNVNLMYVAFTRAEERMYIFSNFNPKKTPDSGQLDTAADLLRLVMQDDAFDSPEETLYESGIPVPKQSAGEAESAPVTSYPALPWRNRIRIERASRKVWGEIGAEVQESLLLAEALRNMRSSEDLLPALSTLAQNGNIPEAQLDVFFSQWRKLLSEAPLREWFSAEAEAMTQLNFGKPSGELWTLDRAVMLKDKTVLIQFSNEKDFNADVKLLKQCAGLLQPELPEEKYIYLTDQLKAVPLGKA